GYETEPDFEQLDTLLNATDREFLSWLGELIGLCPSLFCSSSCIPLGSPPQVSIAGHKAGEERSWRMTPLHFLSFAGQYRELLLKQMTDGQQAEACSWKISRSTLFLIWSPAAFSSRPRALGRKIYSLRAPRCS
uniref:Uncharacterized protein n=1 Tax=Sus scrofa TaxID=9823 RepID=A0A8D1AU17_PIG